MVDGKKAIVVDYKFGQKEEKSYIRQVGFIVKHYGRWVILMWQVIFGTFPWGK